MVSVRTRLCDSSFKYMAYLGPITLWAFTRPNTICSPWNSGCSSNEVQRSLRLLKITSRDMIHNLCTCKMTLSFSNIFVWFYFWFWIFFGIVICIAIVIGCRRFFNSFCGISYIGWCSCCVTWLLDLRRRNLYCFTIRCRTIGRTILFRNWFFDIYSILIGRSRLRPFFYGFYEVTAMWNPCGCYSGCH